MVEDNTEVAETSLSGFPIIMTLGERVNKFYNYHKKIITRPKIEDPVE